MKKVMDLETTNDDILFESLQREKKSQKRKKTIRTLVIIGVIAALLVFAVSRLQKKVDQLVFETSNAPKLFAAEYGSVNTTVTGSGALEDLEPEKISVPGGVEVLKVLVDESAKVEEGELLATVDMATVTSSMADIQAQMDKKDRELADAASEREARFITASLSGRVKILFAMPGDDVASCMVENGALAVLSQDGWLGVELDAEIADPAVPLYVLLKDGSTVRGKIEKAVNGKTVVLISDAQKEAIPDESVTVQDENGNEIGRGTLYIHNPIRIVGYSGTVSAVNVRLNQTVYNGSRLFTLADVESSAKYDLILKQRAELEKTLLALLKIYRDGGLCAPFSGTVLSIEYNKNTNSEQSAEQTALAGYAAAAAAQTAAKSDGKETGILTLSKDEQMTVTIPVDEADILMLEVGQSAELTVASIGQESYPGTVTEINRSPVKLKGGESASYTAEIRLDKTEGMLGGMTARISIMIAGRDHVLRVPTAAVSRTSRSAIVYTGFDELRSELAGSVEVTTGASNKDYTEIVSGLEEGAEVYYFEPDEDLYGFDYEAGYAEEEYVVGGESA